MKAGLGQGLSGCKPVSTFLTPLLASLAGLPSTSVLLLFAAHVIANMLYKSFCTEAVLFCACLLDGRIRPPKYTVRDSGFRPAW